MKALCIIGSPRNNGSTAYLMDELIKGMEKSEIDVSRYCLGNCNINYCLGCKNCYMEGKCIQHDDMDKIIEDYKKSDIVVIGTPDYWGDVSGQLKVFFDRNTPYANTNEKRISMERKRYGISIVVREGDEEKENISIINSLEHYFGHMEIKPIGRISVTKTSTIKDLIEKQKEKIEEAYFLGEGILKKINEDILL